MTTSQQISRAIQKKHGLKGIGIHSQDGCCKFFCDDNVDLGNYIVSLESVMVCHLKHQTVKEWVRDFENAFFDVRLDFNLENLKARFSNEHELTLEFGDYADKAWLLDLIENSCLDIKVKGGYL
ncbi:MAG: hypothetical protein GY804_03895 [Alphaproteobacteria bacterium]|nr:hypothetical protein [Alphaproteobacteria bacterium]